MKCYLFALALELFFDWIPENHPVQDYPYMAPLIAEGIDIRAWDKNLEHMWIFCNLGPKVDEAQLQRQAKERMILFAWEPPTVQPILYDPQIQGYFGKIYTWNDDLVDNVKFFKFYYPVLTQRLADIPLFEQKKFCTLIARKRGSKHPHELYREREKVIQFFEDKKGEFDLYGEFWKKKKIKNWRGPIENKLAVLKNYKFSICYENMRDIKGYVTEKIFDCFAAGVVPVYWGASNITDFVPADCFIDRRRFKNNQEMYDFLKGMKKGEYEQYLQNAARFLQSPEAERFSVAHFLKIFKEATLQ